ncbi:hypothetical protein D3C85_1081070 [compost metagenome]
MPARTPAHKDRRGVGTHGVVAQHIAVQAAGHILGGGAARVVVGRRDIVQDHGVQAAAGAVTIAVRQHNIETFGQSGISGRLSVSLVIAQGIVIGDTANPGHGVVADASDQQLIAQRAGDRLRETADDLTIADKRDATQRQALDTVRRIEGKNTTLGQGRCVGGTAIHQRGFIQDKFTTVGLQPPQGNGLIHRGDGDSQGRGIRPSTIRHYVIGRRHRARIVEGRGKGVGSVGIDD